MRQLITGCVAVALIVVAAVVFLHKHVPTPKVAVAPIARNPAATRPRPRLPTVPLPSTRPVLATLTPLPAIKLTAESAVKMFPAFKHAPYETSGFNPLALPFRYEDPDNVGDQSEANAFAFLLSDALDWAPGNYCTRHAYFVFERSPELRGLARSYDRRLIAREIDGWSATCAVGGVIRRTRAGCAGTLEFYGTDGALQFQKRYDSPRDYFALLGDMAVDAIGHFGPPPTAELAIYLHAPRCQRPDSIVRLGMAAFRPLRGNATFGLYANILEEDPTFAEVRYWWADQKNWEIGDRPERERQVGRSLHDRITPTAIATFDADACRDAGLVREYPGWLATMTRLAGADSPLALQLTLERKTDAYQYDPALYHRALTAAAAYPNDAWLLESVAAASQENVGGPLDARLAASLSATAIASRTLDPTGTYEHEWRYLSAAARLLGRPDVAIAAREAVGPVDGTWDVNRWVIDLCEAGRFTDALTLFTTAEPMPHDESAVEAAQWAAVAAVAAGDGPAMAHLRDAWGGPLGEYGVDLMLGAYNPVDGRPMPVDYGTLAGGIRHRWTGPVPVPCVALAAATDLAYGRSDFRWDLLAMINTHPNCRLLWPLLDGYERQRPTSYGPYLYTSLRWLRPHDPWVTAAYADWTARGRPGPAAFGAVVGRVRAGLSEYPPDAAPVRDHSRIQSAIDRITDEASPWMVTGVVETMLRRDDDAGARDIALRFRHLAVDMPNPEPAAFAGELVARTAAPR